MEPSEQLAYLHIVAVRNFYLFQLSAGQEVDKFWLPKHFFQVERI